LLPPLTTSQAQLDRVAHILAQVLSDSDGGTCR